MKNQNSKNNISKSTNKKDIAYLIKSIFSGENSTYIFTISIALLLRFIFAIIFLGHPTDMGCFKGWSIGAAKDLTGFYSSGGFVDYPPVYIYILFIIGKFVQIFNITSVDWLFNFIIKLPSMLADIVTALLIFKIALKHLNKVMSFIVLLLYLFNPVTILNSAFWGQVDSFFTMMILIGIYLIHTDRLTASSLVLTAAVLMKPQGLFFIPIIGIYLLKTMDWKLIVRSILASLALAVVIVLPFSQNGNIFWIIGLFQKTAAQYAYASLNAFNLFSLLGANWKPDSDTLLIFNYSTWGYIFIGLTVIASILMSVFSKEKAMPFLSSLFIITGIYVLAHKMHERYMFPAMALALGAYALTANRHILIIYFLSILTGFTNTWIVYQLSTKQIFWIDASDFQMKFFSAINVFILAYLVFIVIKFLQNKQTKAIEVINS